MVVGSIIYYTPTAIRSPVCITAIIDGAKKNILLAPADCFPLCKYSTVTEGPAASAM
jgi:hypothetical protein